MILVIDAYNILKQVSSERYISDAYRQNFVELLGMYARIKGHKIIAVFDGGPYDRVFKERVSGVYVVYSGVQETADDYIRNYLQEHKAYDMLLISSDRTLNIWAMRLGIESIDSMDFYAMMCSAVAQKSKQPQHKRDQLVKLSADDKPDLDSLMAENSDYVVTKSDDAQASTRKGSAQRLSKKERVIIKKITKL